MTTPNLQLPEPPDFASPIAAEERDGQRALDALGPGWIAVLSMATAAPPGGSSQGDRYIVPTGATGAWSGHARHVAYLTPGGWAFRAPRKGWVALVLDQGDNGRVWQYSGTDWVQMTTEALGSALDALNVTFDGYGFPTDPMNVDAALETLFDLVNTALLMGGALAGTVAASISRSTAQTIADSSSDAVNFDNVFRDDGGLFDISTPTRFTVPTGAAGWYGITGSIHWAGVTGLGRRTLIRKNGATFLGGGSSPAPADHNDPRTVATTFAFLNDGDYVELIAVQNSGSSVATVASEVFFSIARQGTSAAGGGAGTSALTFIGESVASGGDLSLTVSSIPNTFRSLMVVVHGRGSEANIFEQVYLQFNGDTGNNYDHVQHYGLNSATGSDNVGTTSSVRVGHITGSTAAANRPGHVTAFIHDYASAVFDKLVSSNGGVIATTTPSQNLVDHYAGVWRPATPVAISSITLIPNSGTFTAGSRLSVYGF